MSTLPADYTNLLDLRQTEKAIKLVKDSFERTLSAELRLYRVTSPLFLPSGQGINDDLNGTEAPVRFRVSALGGAQMEIVQSLAKWKRMALADYGYGPDTGIYTDMNALRPDDVVDPIHSVYVDQWDWELVIEPAKRTFETLQVVVRQIYQALRRTEFIVHEQYPQLTLALPEDITFVSTSQLQALYPSLDPPAREREIARTHRAVFLYAIGWPLADGISHSGRAPDYDDWNLNGDIVLWDEVRNDSLEISSMGIRVDSAALNLQLEAAGQLSRKNLYWHSRLLAGEFPQTIGGGIGQSRLCMYFLKKAHIGEVQAAVWPGDQVLELKNRGIPLM